MRILALALLLAAGAPGLGEVRRLSLAGEHEAALAAVEAALSAPEFELAPESERAEAWFTIGVAQHRAEAPEAALDAFLEARDLAGPGRTRLAAMYDLGTILLEQAELVRATIPELAAANGQAPAAPAAPTAPGAAPEEEAPDPLELAREGYLGARRALVDRLRTEPGDADTRANLELIVRRLRELDDIEQQREEQEQEQQDQESEDQEPSEDSEDSEGEDSEEQDQEPGEDQESEPQDEGQESEDSEDEQPPEDEGEQEGSEDEPEQQPDPETLEEQELMTSEEIQRLMDRLREIEEQARAVQAMLRRREHVPVEKDW